MLYQAYKKKLFKWLDIFDRLWHFRFLILGILLLLIAMLVVLFTVPGSIYGESCPQSIVYGEDLPFQAKAVLGRVSVEYREEGADEWTEEMPRRVGEYQVRAVSRGIAGNAKYGQTFSYSILPMETEVVFSAEDYLYGEEPSFAADLAYQDALNVVDFSFAVTAEGRCTIEAGTVAIKNGSGEDVTDCYALALKTKEVAFHARPLHIAVDGAQKVYDGAPLTAGGYRILSGSIAEGDTLELNLTAALTDVGEISNIPEFFIRSESGEDVARYYDIEWEIGTLAILPREVTVATDSAQKVYDGTPLTADGYQILSGSIAEGERLEISLPATLTDVGLLTNDPIFAVRSASGGDVTHNYNLQWEIGTIEVSLREIAIATASAQKVYDGTPISAPEYSITSGSIAPGQQLHISFPDSLTDVSSILNEPELYILGAEGDRVTDNYTIALDLGTIEVLPISIVLRTHSAQKMYDGAPLFGGEVEAEGLPAGHTLQVSSDAVFTDVGVYDNVPQIYIADRTGRDVTLNFEPIWYAGTLTITARPIAVGTNSATWIYEEGMVYSLSGREDYWLLADSENPLVDGHSMYVTPSSASAATLTGVTDTDTRVVYVDNALEMYILDEYGNNVTSNYDIRYEYGKLRVKTKIILTVYGISKYYDGAPLTFTDEDYTLVKPPDVRVEFSLPHLTEVGQLYLFDSEFTRMSMDAYDVVTGANVNDENIFVLDGNYSWPVLEVRPRQIMIASISITGENKGEPLYGNSAGENSAYVSFGSLVAGHTIEIEVTGVLNSDQEWAENTIEDVTIYDERGRDVTSFYEISYRFGILRWE